MGKFLKWAGIVFAVLVVVFVVQYVTYGGTDSDDPTLSEFLDRLEAGEVASVTLVPRREELEVTPGPGSDSADEYEVAYPDDYSGPLIAELRSEDVAFEVDRSKGAAASWFVYLLPFAIFVGFWLWLARRLDQLGDRLDAIGGRRP
jgi:cell division protease FtsH